MAVLDKLSICGIRSFSPMKEEHISFSTPVTLILGQNGCGKTTIIEAIKYACTGEVPPGTSGGRGFLNDPNLSHQQTTKGAVKIKFFDQHGNDITVGRFMQIIQRGPQVQFKTLLPQLKFRKAGDPGNPQDITGRCVDINAYCSEALNVSSAILNNVLFCHQENSSWPLDEAQKLKSRFDEIFDAVKYNKCVETLRKIQKTKVEEIKLMKEQLRSREEAKERSETLKEKIQSRETKFRSIEEKIVEKNNEVMPVEERIMEILELEDTLGSLQRDLTSKDEKRKGLVEQQVNIKKHISFIFEGTDEELQNKIGCFDAENQRDQQQVVELEKRQNMFEDKIVDIKKNLQKSNVKMGQLNEEKRQQDKRFEEREELISNACSELKIHNSSGKLEDYKYSIEMIKSALEAKQLCLDDLIVEKEVEEIEVQKEIDVLIEKHSKAKQEIASKTTTISENQKKLREVGNLLTDLSNKISMMGSIDRKVDDVQRTLISVTSAVNEQEKLEEIEKYRENIGETERTLEKLESEYRILQQNNVNEEMIEKERENIVDKKSVISGLKSKHSEHLYQLFEENVPVNNLRSKITEIMNQEERKQKDLNQNVTATQKEVTKVEIEIKNKKNEINKNESLLKAKQSEVFKLCQTRSLPDVLNSTLVIKEEMQSKKGTLKSAKVMYETFIKEFENKKPCCPVCSTDFSTKKAVVNNIIVTLKDKIKNIPHEIVENERKLKEKEELYDKLQQLNPVSNEVEMLLNTLPASKAELIKFEKKLDTLYAQLDITKTEAEEHQKRVNICRSLLPDVTLIDQYNSDISKSESHIRNLESKLIQVASKRSRQETESEIDDAKGVLNNMRNNCETVKKTLEKHRNRCQELRLEKEKLLEKQMTIKLDTQEIPHLKTRRNEIQDILKKVKSELEIVIKTEETLSGQLNNAKDKKRDVCQSNKQIIQEETKNINAIKKLVDDIEKLEEVINDYIEKKNGEKLLECEKVLEELQNKEFDFIQGKKKIIDAVSKKKEDLARQESNFRALKDNILLREKIKEENEVKAEMEVMNNQIGNRSYRSVYEEKNKLLKKKELIIREINNIEGQKEELEKTLTEFKTELEKPGNKDAHQLYKKKFFELKLAELVLVDIMKYTVILEKSILQFHKDRMVQINKIIRELWRAIYRGNDVDYIEIKTEDAIGTNAKRRSYNYKVVMLKNGVEIEMRGRCSAGQRVLACLVIRMALAETFSAHCGILALDEPTTNLDRQNILSLSDALSNIIETRRNEKNFQLLVITHDEDFLNTLTRVQSTPHYWKVARNGSGFSIINKVTI